MTKPGRNAPCPCGSGKKYKRCCEEADVLAQLSHMMMEGEEVDDDDKMVPGEERLYNCVCDTILIGVWMGFHPTGTPIPKVEELEDFYMEIYGDYLDPFLVREIINPLSPYARARLKSVADQEGTIDIGPAPVEGQKPADGLK